jgi:hypothetical protein
MKFPLRDTSMRSSSRYESREIHSPCILCSSLSSEGPNTPLFFEIYSPTGHTCTMIVQVIPHAQACTFFGASPSRAAHRMCLAVNMFPRPDDFHVVICAQYSMDGDACRQIQDALLSRLEIKSSNVKLKGLRLVKLLCERGSPNFKRDLQRRTPVVRDCLHWRCDPHPTMGELPAKMVREAAQEAMNAIFDTEVRPQPATQPAPNSSASSFASAPQTQPAPGYTSFSSAMASSSMPSTLSTPQASSIASTDKSKYTGFGRDTAPSSGPVIPDRSILSYASQQPSTYSSGGEPRIGGFGNAPTAGAHKPSLFAVFETCEKVQVGDFFLYVCVLVSLPAVPAAVGIDQVYQVGAKAATAFRSVKYYCGLFAL